MGMFDAVNLTPALEFTPSFAIRRAFFKNGHLFTTFVEKLKSPTLHPQFGETIGINYEAWLYNLMGQYALWLVDCPDAKPRDKISFFLTFMGPAKMLNVLRHLFGHHMFPTVPLLDRNGMNSIAAPGVILDAMAAAKITRMSMDLFLDEGVFNGVPLSRPRCVPLTDHIRTLMEGPLGQYTTFVFAAIFHEFEAVEATKVIFRNSIVLTSSAALDDEILPNVK